MSGIPQRANVLGKPTEWGGDRGDAALASQASDDEQAASTANIGGTPGFLIERSGDALKHFEPGSFTETASFEEAIERLLRS